MSTFVTPSNSSSHILEKIQTGVSFISEFVFKSLINKNFNNFKTTNNAHMKLKRLSKLERRDATLSKKSRRQNVNKF